MDSVDVSNRKPRRFTGTPAAKLRTYVSAAAVVYTLIAGGLLMLSPYDQDLRELAQLHYEARKEEDLETTDEEKMRRSAMLRLFRYASEAKKSDAQWRAQEEEKA